MTLRSTKRLVTLPAALSLILGASLAHAQSAAASPDPERFAADIEAFEELDRKNTPPKGAVLFVGSSSIRLWATAERFPTMTVINRGFGGAHIADVNHYFDRTVRKYAANVVLLYAGDNDIGNGKTVDRVFADYQTFVNNVHSARPDTEVVFIAVKPSPARWALWPTVKALNERIRTFSASRPRLHFVDVAPPMLGPDGRPRPELFVEDGLHMTPAGYDIWTSLVARALTPLVRK